MNNIISIGSPIGKDLFMHKMITRLKVTTPEVEYPIRIEKINKNN